MQTMQNQAISIQEQEGNFCAKTWTKKHKNLRWRR